MSSFHLLVAQSISPKFQTATFESGYLTPPAALSFFGIGLLLSNLAVNTVFMKADGPTDSRYFGGGPKLQSLGILSLPPVVLA